MPQTLSDAPTEREAPPSAAELDRRLDEALKESFPASDPIAVIVTRR